MRRSVYPALSIAVLLGLPAAAFPAQAQTFESSAGRLRVVTVARGLSHPWSLAFLPSGRMLVTERPGRLRIVTRNGGVGAPVRGLPRIAVSGQGGLLDVVADPDFARNRTIFFSFSEPGGSGAGTAVARARLDGNALTGLKIIFRMVPKSRGGRHFGSRIVVARDGTLFVTLGERGQRDRAQDTSIHRGQVIRIWKNDSIPKDNPFVGRKGFRPEIWSYGHRNPQGAALHPVTGQLWIHEHGARGGDEVNIPKAGRNYGWPIIAYGRHYWGGRIGEGTSKPGLEQPVHYWDPSIAPSGMAFVTGPVFSAWRGDLLVGALSYRMLVRLRFDGTKPVQEERLLEAMDERIRDVRIGPARLYLAADGQRGRARAQDGTVAMTSPRSGTGQKRGVSARKLRLRCS